MHANIDDFKTSKDLGCERRSGEASRDYRGANPSKVAPLYPRQWQSLSTPRLYLPRSGCAYVNHNQKDTGDGERNFILECMLILMISRPQKI